MYELIKDKQLIMNRILNFDIDVDSFTKAFLVLYFIRY